MPRSLNPVFAFAVCCAIWGTTFLVIKRSNEALDPLWGVALRLGIAAVILGAVWAIRRTPRPRGRALGVVIVFGLLDFGANLALLYWGEQTVSSSLAAIFFATSPIIALVLAASIGQEKLDSVRLVAMLVAFGGVVLIFHSQLTVRADPWAMLAVLGASVSVAAATVLLRSVPPQPLVPTVAIGCGLSSVLLVPVSLAAGERHVVPTSWDAWWPVLYLAIGGSVVAFGIFTWLLSRWHASSVTLAGVVVPVIAVILGTLAADERLQPMTLGGAVVVLVAVTISLLRARQVQRSGYPTTAPR